MAIQDDFTIDYVDRKITYTTAFVDDRPPNIYTVNELYSYLQDTFDEPAQMDDPVPMSAQTPTQYTVINRWFIDDESVKALYGGSIQTSGWAKSGDTGITQLRWENGSADPPTSADIGQSITENSSGAASGIILAVDATRQVVWVRNTSTAQFGDGENVLGDGTAIDFDVEVINGVESGETVWSNLFSVGSLQSETEIYVGQEDDYMGGTAYHTSNTLARKIEKIDEWWDSDVDFFTGSPNLLGGAGHFDVLIKTQEAGNTIDGSRLAVFSRQFSKVYSHFELVGGVGNFVVPFASTGADLNSQDGPYNIGFDAGAGGKGQLDAGDVLENDTGTSPVGRLRAVVTAVNGTTSGDFDYYLIGENEPLTTTDRTLRQFAENENVAVRGDGFTFDIDATGTPLSSQGPGTAQGITITFADTQVDVDENGTPEEYACTIDCNNVALAEVYKRTQFLTCRGNQDGTTTDTQDTLLPSEATGDETSEFYRAVGDIVFEYDGGTGTQPTEGDHVENNGATATGVVVSVTAGTTGTCVLTQVKGTWVNNDQVVLTQGDLGVNQIVVAGSPRSIVDNTAAPFGTFAGGRWFLAQGVVLTNVPVADANNWQAIDLTGATRIPPTVRTITFAGLIANDRAALFEVDTAGEDDITKNQNGVGPAGASVSDTSIPLDSTVALDVPSTGWIRVVDTSEASLGTEYRYEYSAVSGTTVTLRTGAGLTGTTTGSESATILTDTSAFTSFGTDGNVKIGMEIRNIDDGSRAVVLRKIDNDSIETTPLTGGTDNTWHSSGTADNWEANQIVVALVDADTVYFPFIDDVASTTSIAKTIKYVADTPCIARARFSDPDVGGTRILPFEQKNITVTDANLTVTAIRTEDTIASP